ncbi:MAG: diacylglycerol kinase family protein [Myxococcaceae bacterium]
MWVQPFRADVEHIPGRAEEQKVAVLLNANARKVTSKIVRALSHVVPAGDLYLSRSELDARRIAQQVVDRGYQTLFLGGGDGTVTCFVNEVLTQVALRRAHHPIRAPRFGVLKLGTGNSVASLVKASSTRADGFVDDVLKARAGEVPGYRTIDLLLIDGKRAPFAGLGLDGKLLNDYNWVKRNFGQGALKKMMTGAGGYFASVAFKTVPHYLMNSTSVTCEVVNGPATAYRMGPDGAPVESIKPGELLYSGDLMMAAAGTVPFYGFELKMFPFAGKRRGMMNLRLGTVPTTRILANLPKLWAGTWFPEGINDFLVKDATIRFSREMPFQISGDAEGYRNEVHFQVAPEPIDVVDFTGSLH